MVWPRTNVEQADAKTGRSPAADYHVGSTRNHIQEVEATVIKATAAAAFFACCRTDEHNFICCLPLEAECNRHDKKDGSKMDSMLEGLHQL